MKGNNKLMFLYLLYKNSTILIYNSDWSTEDATCNNAVENVLHVVGVFLIKCLHS